ncbi:MAG: hypothetical protein AABY73_02385 [Pseudomonadota bacterium]
MQTSLIELPSIRDDGSGYNYLFKLAANIIADPHRHFNFNFKKCAILDQNAIAMLGGLARYVDSHNTIANSGLSGIILQKCGVMFQVESMSQIISELLIENNFLSHFSKENFDGYPEGDYIGYRQHMEYLDANAIASHLNHQWLSDEKISISPDLKNAIVSRIFEIFMNAYGHGVERCKTPGLGVISCGRYYKKESKLKLTVVDFGCGIIENIKAHLKSDIDDIAATRWALETGNSTKTDSMYEHIPRGLGFGLLAEFVSLNKGDLSVFSNSCCAKVSENGNYDVSRMKTPFSGTMVNIAINCDGRHYKFISDSAGTEQYF